MALTRRQFLIGCAAMAGGVALAGTGALFAEFKNTDPFDLYVQATRDVLARRFGQDAAVAMHAEIGREYQSLLPGLPDIGGEANLNAGNLQASAYCLAEYRVLRGRGRTTEEAGRCIYQAFEAASDLPQWLGHAVGRLQHNKRNQEQWRAQAARSQKRQYPADWVFTFVEGDGLTFDYGLDFTECGICKYYHVQGADELAPYLCLMDGVVSETFGYGLVRHRTLAEGADLCDFRYKAGRETFLYPLRHGWPPQFRAEDA